MQRLAMESTVITIDGYQFVLRPTLRAAARLEQIYGGYQALIEAFASYDFKALADIVVESSDDGDDALRKLSKAVGNMPLGELFQLLASPIGKHLGALVGFDPDATEEPQGPPMSFTDYHEALFKIGTGWLGWTPAQTLDATPMEITVARTGYIEKMRAIYLPGQLAEDQSKEVSKEELKAMSRQRIGQRV